MAGMMKLLALGWLSARVRVVVASFWGLVRN